MIARDEVRIVHRDGELQTVDRQWLLAVLREHVERLPCGLSGLTRRSKTGVWELDATELVATQAILPN